MTLPFEALAGKSKGSETSNFLTAPFLRPRSHSTQLCLNPICFPSCRHRQTFGASLFLAWHEMLPSPSNLPGHLPTTNPPENYPPCLIQTGKAHGRLCRAVALAPATARCTQWLRRRLALHELRASRMRSTSTNACNGWQRHSPFVASTCRC